MFHSFKLTLLRFDILNVKGYPVFCMTYSLQYVIVSTLPEAGKNNDTSFVFCLAATSSSKNTLIKKKLKRLF